MKRTLWLLSLALLASVLLPPHGETQSLPPYENPNLPVEQRVNDLVSRMTLEEKVSLMMNASAAIERLGIPQRGRYQGLTFWSPNVNIFRDSRWGRGQEAYGEDPYLTGQMGVQFVEDFFNPH